MIALVAFALIVVVAGGLDALDVLRCGRERKEDASARVGLARAERAVPHSWLGGGTVVTVFFDAHARARGCAPEVPVFSVRQPGMGIGVALPGRLPRVPVQPHRADGVEALVALLDEDSERG